MDLHDIASQVATTSGADFAFVLSQAGLLVTRDAPRDMPDGGRTKILWACPPGKSEIAHLEMPRQELVPFGGAAPIDVFAIRVEDTAILVAVMSSWNDKGNVVLALTTGAAALGEMIRNAKHVRAQKVARQAEGGRRERASAVPAEPARRERVAVLPADGGRRGRTSVLPPEGGRRERTSALPAEPSRRDRASGAPKEPARRERTSVAPPESGRRERTSVLPKGPKDAAAKKAPKADAANAARLEALAARVQAAAKRREARARASSEPEITMGEALVGRETLVAIEAALPALPAGPSPESVRVELDSIGRETMLEIARFEAAEMARSPTVEEPLVVNDRRTMPWVDTASLKRTVDAKAAVRGVAPPELKVTVEEMDPDALERALRDDTKR